MFKAYASSDSTTTEASTSNNKITTAETTTNTWLENKSFAGELPNVSTAVIPKPVAAVVPKEEKKRLPTVVPSEASSKPEIFFIDLRRDRANLTVQYTRGVPRYGFKFCNQRPLGAGINKKKRKQRIPRYFHLKFEPTDAFTTEGMVKVDSRLEQLNIAVREQPHSFDAWKELIDYQWYLFKNSGEKDQYQAIFTKQLAIADRALEQNNNRLPYRLLKLNLRTESLLFDNEILLNEWTSLVKDCQKSSDDRTINDCWLSYIQFLLNRIELFSLEKLHEVFGQYFSSYLYQMQTRSEKERRSLLNQMIEMFQIWMYVLRDAGYPERSIALYQSMIELQIQPLNEKKIDFQQRLESFARTWDSEKLRFGETKDFSASVDHFENELKTLSEEENRRFDSTYSSWIVVEELRERFYRDQLINRGFHLHSSLLQRLEDSSQIDEDLSSMTFNRSIRPFLFECLDQRHVLQLIIDYLHLINGFPRWNFVRQIVQRWKISFSSYFHDQLFLQSEIRQLKSFTPSERPIFTEENFSIEFVSRFYEQILQVPSLKIYQIDFLLLYWYYLAENLLELKQQNQWKKNEEISSLCKTRLKSLQGLIKKYLGTEEYRTCLRLYTHYAHLEHEYFQRRIESRRIFDLCFQTIRSNPTNFASFDSANDLCHYLLTLLKCEFDIEHLFDRMTETVLTHSMGKSIDRDVNREKLISTIEFLLKKLFPNNQFNEIISLLIDALKSRKASKWDQKGEHDWSNYLRQNISLSLEILLIFLHYSSLLNDPLEKLHQILRQTLLPLFNEERTNKNNQFIIDEILLFYLSRLWNDFFTEQMSFDQCTNYLKEIFDVIQWPSMILWKFTSIYACFLPLYGNSVKQFEDLMLNYRFNPKNEFRLMTKFYVLQMNFLRHLKIQRANPLLEYGNSGYEHRVRHRLRQLLRHYPLYIELWLFDEYFERSTPTNETRVKAVLYDAMQNCPWAKIFYKKSIKSVTNETEWKLFVSVMLKSNVHVFFTLEEFDMLKELVEMKKE